MRQLALVMFAVSLSSCASGPSEPTPAGPVRVSGRVLDYATNAGVGGVTITYDDIAGTTDATGAYSVTAPVGRFQPRVDGASAGVSIVTGTGYRGDFFVRSGDCIARYGSISDAATHRPIAGVRVSLGETAITDADGWYRLDVGCVPGGRLGFNTAFMAASHPLYADAPQVVGRGIAGVTRLDFEMQRR